jgi:SAM-dependent methyltransferase
MMNRESYNSIARQWDSARVSFVKDERQYLEALLSGLAAPASVLDVGCGTGRPIAEFILGRGHRLTGIDQSEELLTIARARFPEGTWIHASIEGYVFEGSYDAIVCWDTLFHIERAHHQRLLTDLRDCLTPHGRLMLTAGGSANPPFTDTMFAREFFYDSHPPELLCSMMRETGYELLIDEFMDVPTSGRDKGRIAIVAQRSPTKQTSSGRPGG